VTLLIALRARGPCSVRSHQLARGYELSAATAAFLLARDPLPHIPGSRGRSAAQSTLHREFRKCIAPTRVCRHRAVISFGLIQQAGYGASSANKRHLFDLDQQSYPVLGIEWRAAMPAWSSMPCGLTIESQYSKDKLHECESECGGQRAARRDDTW